MKKIKLFTVALFAGFFLQQLALAQTNVAATGNEPVATPVGNPAADAAAGGAPAPMTGGSGNETAASVSTNSETAGTNAAVATTVPIQFQDIPITTAIESLARLAGINYLLDPKIGYGQPDQNGQIKPEPTLSVRWENVTAEQALVSVLDNYGLQLVENPKTKIAKITTKDPSAPPPLITRVFQLKYSSTSNMNFAVGSSLTDKRSRVVPDTRTSQLVVIATEPEQEAVDTLLNLLDKPTRQVLIETHLVELSSNPSTEKGVDWSGTLQAQNVSFGNNALNTLSPQSAIPASAGPPPTLAQPATQGTIGGILSNPQLLMNTANGFNPATFFLNADGAHAVLSFLNASSDAQVISTPRVVTLDNEAATIQVVRAFPVFNTTAGTQGSPGGSQLTYSNLGTTLVVTPRISANDYIWLKVVPSVSSFFGKETETINGLVNTADIFDTRTIDTQVLIPNAHTLVMGGLVKDNPNTSYTKVPFLGDIPILGLAFRHEAKSMEKDNLLIFICPTIVTDSDFKSTVTSFLDTKPKTMKDAMNPHTMWDGGAPHGNWSNPLPQGDYDKISGEDQTSQMPVPSK
jgi:type II secretory pathway component GspD/PulD (secretin)